MREVRELPVTTSLRITVRRWDFLFLSTSRPKTASQEVNALVVLVGNEPNVSVSALYDDGHSQPGRDRPRSGEPHDKPLRRSRTTERPEQRPDPRRERPRRDSQAHHQERLRHRSARLATGPAGSLPRVPGAGRPEPSSRPTRRRRARPVGQPAAEGNESGGHPRRPASRRRRRPIASTPGTSTQERLSHRSRGPRPEMAGPGRTPPGLTGPPEQDRADDDEHDTGSRVWLVSRTGLGGLPGPSPIVN